MSFSIICLMAEFRRQGYWTPLTLSCIIEVIDERHLDHYVLH